MPRFLAKSLDDFRLAGVDKDEATRARLAAIQGDIKKLSQDYSQNVNSGTQTRLNTTTWLTVARGTGATAGTAIGVQLNANKEPGKNGVVPTAAQLAAVLAWQVVAYP